MKRLLLPLIGLLFFVLGCPKSQLINEELYSTYLTKTYNYSKDKCFNAALAALKENKIGVEKQDREKGLITSEKTELYTVVEVRGTQYSAAGRTIQANHKYYLQITGDNKSATVKVIRYRLWRDAVEQTKLNAAWCKKNVWDPFFSSIQDHLESI